MCNGNSLEPVNRINLISFKKVSKHDNSIAIQFSISDISAINPLIKQGLQGLQFHIFARSSSDRTGCYDVFSSSKTICLDVPLLIC